MKEGQQEVERNEINPQEVVNQLGEFLSQFLATRFDIGIPKGEGPRMLKRMGLGVRQIQDEIDSWKPYLKNPVTIQGGRKVHLLPPMSEKK